MLKTLAGIAAAGALSLLAPSEAQAGDWRVELRFGDCGSRTRISYVRARYYDCVPCCDCAPRYYYVDEGPCHPRYVYRDDCRPRYGYYAVRYRYCR
jgi:hypothetical protein